MQMSSTPTQLTLPYSTPTPTLLYLGPVPLFITCWNVWCYSSVSAVIISVFDGVVEKTIIIISDILVFFGSTPKFVDILWDRFPQRPTFNPTCGFNSPTVAVPAEHSRQRRAVSFCQTTVFGCVVAFGFFMCHTPSACGGAVDCEQTQSPMLLFVRSTPQLLDRNTGCVSQFESGYPQPQPSWQDWNQANIFSLPQRFSCTRTATWISPTCAHHKWGRFKWPSFIGNSVLGVYFRGMGMQTGVAMNIFSEFVSLLIIWSWSPYDHILRSYFSLGVCQ